MPFGPSLSKEGGAPVGAPPSLPQAAFRLTAEVLPCCPRSRSKLTFWPSLRVPRSERSTAEMWTKTSFEPSTGVMKPKPFVGLNHLTVPVCMNCAPNQDVPRRDDRAPDRTFQGKITWSGLKKAAERAGPKEFDAPDMRPWPPICKEQRPGRNSYRRCPLLQG